MQRKRLVTADGSLSYLDNERAGDVLVCLHGHFGCGAMFAFLSEVFPGRLLALDQRGHGYSDRFPSYQTADYVGDLRELLDQEHVQRAIVLGHSLGGVNAFHFAACHKDRVKALVIEDIGTEVEASNEFFAVLPTEFHSMEEVAEQFRKNNIAFEPYFLESLRYDGLRWRFQFNYQDMIESQKQMNGNHDDQWNNLECPTLLLHGTNSQVCRTINIMAMSEARPNVVLRVYEGCGHTPHAENKSEFTKDVLRFINSLSSER